MILAHVGDSRAVLCKQGLAVGTSGNHLKRCHIGPFASASCYHWCSDEKKQFVVYAGSYKTPLRASI